MHDYHKRDHYIHVPHMAILRVTIPRVTIPHVVHDKLHEMCMFHAMRKRGLRKHVTRLFIVLSC